MVSITRSNNRIPCMGICYALLFLALFPPSVQTFQPTTVPSPLQQRQQSSKSYPTLSSHQSTRTALTAVSQRQAFIIDGGELQSFLLHNDNGAAAGSGRRNSPQAGCLTLVAGTTNESPSRRIVAVEKSSDTDNEPVSNNEYDTISLGNVQVYKHTMATIPDKVSDGDAISTAAATVVGIHCAIPKVEDVGGSEDGVFYSGKAVVMGGNDYACFLADGLATLGIDVSLISTGGAKTSNKQVKMMQPSVDVGEDEVGFAAAIGQFDSIIDTVSNEQKGIVITAGNPTGGSSVLQLLQARHQCDKYISTMTESQEILKGGGIIFGRGKANDHVKSMESISPRRCLPLIPSAGFGPSTLQILLENNVLFSTKNTKPTAVRGWELKNFWEETSWPRDSSGTGVRFGLPVVEDDDLDELFRIEQIQLQKRKTRIGSEEGGLDNKEVTVQSKVDQRNPYVLQIEGVEGLAEEIIYPRKNCVVFVAMRSCRTCKGINPIFTKLARDDDCGGGTMMFAKADATGAAGKALGKQLGIIAVPSFVLFRNGVRYGAVSASKLPSDRLDRAIEDLKSGEDFDTALMEEDD